jgi:hypothetical protein
MDIASRVNYEFLYPLELRDPDTDEPLGIVFQIRSSGSDAAKKVLREHTDKNIQRLVKGRQPTAEQREVEELERVASYIASWDWGPHDWKGAKPALSMKMAIEVLSEAPWIFDAVDGAARKVSNFSQAQPKGLPKS